MKRVAAFIVLAFLSCSTPAIARPGGGETYSRDSGGSSSNSDSDSDSDGDASAAMLMLLLFFIPNPIVENACDVILAPLFLLFIISLAYHQGFLSRLLSNRFLVYLGDISYGIYILQVPLALWYGRLLLKAGIILTDEVVLKYSFIVFLILCSGVSYSFIEKPVRRLLHLRSSRRVEKLRS